MDRGKRRAAQLLATRLREQTHPVETIGSQARAMMPFLQPVAARRTKQQLQRNSGIPLCDISLNRCARVDTQIVLRILFGAEQLRALIHR